jgi:hypothetical protein
MTLTIRCARVSRLKKRFYTILDDAEAAAKATSADPLFDGVQDLSRLVTEIDSIKKRHGTVLKQCILEGVKGMSGWDASIMPNEYMGSKEMVVAWNTDAKQVYAFAAKRGHGDYDASSLSDINKRLSQAQAILPNFAEDKKVSKATLNTFIVSFYGKVWKTQYSVYRTQDLHKIFGAELRHFVRSFMAFNEKVIAERYENRIRGGANQEDLKLENASNIFLDLSQKNLSENSNIILDKEEYKLQR